MPITRRLNRVDYETGKEVLETFGSMKEAIEKYGLFRTNVTNAIKYADGMIPGEKLRFAYADGPNRPVPRYRVIQLDYETGEFIERYDTAEEAAEDNYTSAKSIRIAIRNNSGYIKRKGLRFKYVLE